MLASRKFELSREEIEQSVLEEVVETYGSDLRTVWPVLAQLAPIQKT
jgi:hypothetical protein